MSIATRTNSALYKRAEQLKRWEESDTNREPALPRTKTTRKIKFSSGCVFLAACDAGDKDEVLNLLDKGVDINTANVDGLTALHQACINDNLDMVEFLVEHGADVNRGDNEGWTPLHATSSCGFLYIAKYLIEKGANVAAVNNDGELPIDIAESQKMEDYLREEIQRKGIDCEQARKEEEQTMLKDAKEWLATKSSCVVNQPHPRDGATPLHVACAKGYAEVVKVLLQCAADLDAQDVDGWTPLHAAAHWGQKEICQLLAENLADMDAKNYVGQTAFDLADTDLFRYYLEDLKKKQNKEDVMLRRQAKKRVENQIIDTETPSKLKKIEVEISEQPVKLRENIDDLMEVSDDDDDDDDESSSTESNSSSCSDDDDEKRNKVNSLLIEAERNNTTRETQPPKTLDLNVEIENSTSWRSQFNNAKEASSPVSRNPIGKKLSGSCEIGSSENEMTTLRRAHSFQTDKESNEDKSGTVTTVSAPTSTTTSPTKTSPIVPNNQPQVRRSFVPPVRDEESETQRKAHAKRVRETRRSTQGVTLEEIKSAEQFVKNQNNASTAATETSTTGNSGVNGNSLTSSLSSSNGVSVTATITTVAPPQKTNETEATPIVQERRPSWRLRVDNGTSKFKLEDASKPAVETSSTPSFLRRTPVTSTVPRPASAPPIETTISPPGDTTVTLPLRKPKTQEDKDQDKENDIRNAQQATTQAAIQRRRRPKRRSTGVVQFDNVDDLDQEKDSSAGGDFETNAHESGAEKSSSRSRLGSNSDVVKNDNYGKGDIDYKKLYEQAILENERLKDKLRKSDEELRETKQTLEKLNLVTSKNSLSELEKREKRSMERKLSEMEEELKHLENLKTENQRLKDENGALIRVISKLSK